MEKHVLTIEQELGKIGKRMRQLRKKKGFSSAEKFAFLNDIDRAQYGRYENGNKDLRMSSFINILNALDISWLEFFGEGFEGEQDDTKKKPKL